MKKKHPLWFRILNINRVAAHANNFYRLYRVLGKPEHFPGSTWARHSSYWSTTRKALYEGAINNCDMINDGRGHHLGKILDELIALGQHPDVPLAELRAELVAKAKPIAGRVSLIRNNIFSHRSEHLSFKQVMDRARLHDDELGELIALYLRITDELNVKINKRNPWSLTDSGEGELLSLLGHLNEEPLE